MLNEREYVPGVFLVIQSYHIIASRLYDSINTRRPRFITENSLPVLIRTPRRSKKYRLCEVNSRHRLEAPVEGPVSRTRRGRYQVVTETQQNAGSVRLGHRIKLQS
jgi:hypothetical protein